MNLLNTKEELPGNYVQPDNIFKALSDTSGDIIAILDSNLNYLYINHAITKYTGMSPDEIIGKDIHFSYRSEENVNKMREKIERAIAQNESSELELLINTLQGPRYFNIRIQAHFESSELKNIFIVSRDITELKQHQNILEEKQAYIKISSEILLQPFVIINPVFDESENINDFTYSYVNKAASVSNGIPAQEHYGKTILQLFPLHKENGVFDNLKKAYVTGQPWREVVTYYGAAGDKVMIGIFEISAAKVSGGLVVTWHDITDLHLAQDKLLKSEKKFNLAFNASPAAMILSRMNGEIVDVNKAYEQMFGYSRDELIGKKTSELGIYVDPRDREMLLKIISKEGGVKNQEFEFRNRKREVLHALISVVVFEIANEKHLLSLIIDLTDQKKLELSLQDTLREKIVLLQEVHHRVRNNMQIILSMLNLQRSSITDNLMNDQLLAAQNRIRSMALVYDKLFPSDNYSSINLREYVSTLISGSAESLFSPEVHLEFNIDRNYSINIESAIKIGLILNELISNSLNNTFNFAPKGKVEIRLEHKNGKNLQIDYTEKDNPEVAARSNIHSPESLGLRLVNILVEDLNGTFQILNEENCTRFLIALKVQ